MRQRVQLSGVVLIAVLMAACATSQIQKARQVSVDVHSVLAAVDDAERAIYTSHTVPAWTDAKHAEFSQHLVVALKAGKALNEGVRSAPVSDGAKVSLTTVSTELGTLTGLITGALPPDSKVTLAITAAKDAVLRLLPLFLE